MPKMLLRGGQGVAVRELQGNLARGGIPVKVDGVFGPKTEAAVRQFQAGAHLSVDGVVGAHSWAALHGAPVTPRRVADRAPRHDAMVERLLKEAGQWWEGATAPAATASAPPRTGAPSRTAPPTRSASATSGSSAAQSPHLTTAAETSRYSRIRFDGYEGRGWVVKGYEDLRGKQIHEVGGGRFAVNPAVTKARFINNECVALVKFFGLPATSTWRRGPQVCDFKPGELPVGAIVATLRDGAYHSDYSGRSHVGIYLSHDDHATWTAATKPNAGVQLLDQWNGARIDRHPIKRYAVDANAFGTKAKRAWHDSTGQHSRRVSWAADGEEYFVVMTR